MVVSEVINRAPSSTASLDDVCRRGVEGLGFGAYVVAYREDQHRESVFIAVIHAGVGEGRCSLPTNASADCHKPDLHQSANESKNERQNDGPRFTDMVVSRKWSLGMDKNPREPRFTYRDVSRFAKLFICCEWIVTAKN